MDRYKNINYKKDDNNIIIKGLENREIGYIRIPHMSSSDEELNKIIQYIDGYNDFKNIIIDLRGNYGGRAKVASTIISHLIDRDVEMFNSVFLMNSKYVDKFIESRPSIDQAICDPPKELKKLRELDYDKYVYIKDRIYIKSNRSNKLIPNIYLLADHNTASAGDMLVNIMKNLDLAKVVGTTGGEGLIFNPHINMLPNSKICFYASLTLSYDSKFNMNEKGTKPDYYAEQSILDFKEALKNNVKDIQGSKYDTVLNKCLEIINNNKFNYSK